MKKVIGLLLIGVATWFFFKHQREATYTPELVERPSLSQGSSGFRCEGKTHCSQMTSCEEATFYLQSCPGTQMDGDNDGIPCESQHCRL